MKKFIIYVVLLVVFLSGCVKNETQNPAISEKKYAMENIELRETEKAAETEKKYTTENVEPRETEKAAEIEKKYTTENVEPREIEKAAETEKIEPGNTKTSEIAGQANTNLPDDSDTKKTTVHDEKSQTIDNTQETKLPKKEKTEANMCTLSVSCESVLNNMDRLEKNKSELVPSNGIILPKQSVEICDGESAFDITLKVLKEKKIHFDFVKTIAYNSAYIKGISNIYEFDCGELSGWRYCVNGEYKNCGCSQYYPENGDRIEWIYTCE